MAARKNVIVMTEEWREKIKVSQIMNRLVEHVNGRIQLSPTQVRCAEILLKKVVPDLSSTELKANIQHHYVMRAPTVAPTVEAWQQHNPQVTIQ